MAVRLDSRRKALIAASAARDKHAEEVVMMDLRALSSVTDYFLVATALSRPQLAAMAEAIQEALAQSGGRVEHVEGLTPPRRPPKRLPVGGEEDGFAWVLLDCGSVIVHLLNPPARQFYQLEHLWGDAPRVPVE